jgi:hypothetical protein
VRRASSVGAAGADAPSVTVVVCAHTTERWDMLVAAIDSLRAQSRPPDEILLVVDHEPSLAAHAAKQLQGVTVLESEGPPGLCAARNRGVQAAAGEIVAFLDDDATAAPDWLARLLAPYADPSVLGVGGSIEPAWQEGRPAWYPLEFDWTVGCTYLGMPTTPTPVRNLIGCNMSYRRSVVTAAGGFRLGYSCDETELCLRIGRRHPDGVLLHLPAARVLHRVPPARARPRHFVRRCWFEGGSKVVVARLSGSARGLQSERAYTARVLPAGVARGLGDLLLRGEPGGLGRAAAIVAGLTVTVAGYGAGRLRLDRTAARRGWTGPLPRRADPARG